MIGIKRHLSVLADTIILLSFLTLLGTLLVGDIRWKTSFFRLTIKYISDPLEIIILFIITKTILDLNTGIFYFLEIRRIFLISSISSQVHQYEKSLRRFYIREKTNLVLTVITCCISLCLVEGYFRYFPHTLPLALGNYLASGYNDNLWGIYRYRADMNMLFMRSQYERRMYFNGYYWHHKTDTMGFRNPTELEQAHVVLLGDSMIYGHGVEETSTVRHYLEELAQQPVANLGIQGGSIHQEYQILKSYGTRLHPRYVYLFFLVNDIHDLTAYLSDEDIWTFLHLPLDDHMTPYFHIRQSKNKLIDIDFYIKEINILKAYKFFKNYLKTNQWKIAEVFADSWQSSAFFQKHPRYRLAMQFHLHALRKIQDMAKTEKFQFTHVFIYTGRWHEEERLYERILEDFCQARGIDFYNLRHGFEVARRNGEELFLRFDGHFSDRGARLVARLLAQHMKMRPSGEDH